MFKCTFIVFIRLIFVVHLRNVHVSHHRFSLSSNTGRHRLIIILVEIRRQSDHDEAIIVPLPLQRRSGGTRSIRQSFRKNFFFSPFTLSRVPFLVPLYSSASFDGLPINLLNFGRTAAKTPVLFFFLSACGPTTTTRGVQSQSGADSK